MIFKHKLLYLILISFLIFLSSCSKIRESAGVERKSFDEYTAVENPPLVIPPDFTLIAPNKLEQKNIDEVEQELAKEILFGLEEEQTSEKNISTMNQILSQANADNVSSDIREEIDQDFGKEKKTEGIFKANWKNDIEILDAIEESKRIRNKKYESQSIAEGEVPVITKETTVKKKKRFIFF